jgi:hypothetical protein
MAGSGLSCEELVGAPLGGLGPFAGFPNFPVQRLDPSLGSRGPFRWRLVVGIWIIARLRVLRVFIVLRIVRAILRIVGVVEVLDVVEVVAVFRVHVFGTS